MTKKGLIRIKNDTVVKLLCDGEIVIDPETKIDFPPIILTEESAEKIGKEIAKMMKRGWDIK